LKGFCERKLLKEQFLSLNDFHSSCIREWRKPF
jgi:hypothetical protein